MNSMIDKMEEKMSEGADNVAYYIKENRRKKKEKKDEEDRPIVTINKNHERCLETGTSLFLCLRKEIVWKDIFL